MIDKKSTEESHGLLNVEDPPFQQLNIPRYRSSPSSVFYIVLKILFFLLILFAGYAIYSKMAEPTTVQQWQIPVATTNLQWVTPWFKRFQNQSSYITGRDIDVILATQFNYIPPSQEEIQACKTKRYTKTGGWCLTPDQIIARRKFPKRTLAHYLGKFFEDQTVADIGAGLGIFKEIIIAEGKARYVVAFDGAINVHEVSNGLVQFRDFAKPQNIGVYDWVYSIEVAEHVPKEFEDVFIENLVRAADKGIVMSWAHIGQAGDGHVNNQNRDYVLRKFADKGFYNNEAELEKMKPSAEDYGVNLYVFQKSKLFSHR